jgi:hypothetical protein
MPVSLRCCLPAVSSGVAALLALWGGGSCTTVNIHDTPKARDQPCASCHAEAYNDVQTPVHVGVYPDTCGDCHDTQSWSHFTHGGFPIDTGSHSNPAIGCADCHIASLGGSDFGGQNTDCVDCHIGAHTTPAVDSAHTTVNGYTPSSASDPNAACLSCHPSG